MEGDGTGLELSGPIGPDGAAVTFRGCEHFDTVKEAEGTGTLGISEDGSGDGKSVGAGPSPSL